MKKTVLFLILLQLLLSNCKKEVALQHQSPEVIGYWSSLTPAYPPWLYYFSDDGLLVQTLPSRADSFCYHIQNDTVFIDGNHGNTPRRWHVTFHCDSVMEVRQLDAALFPRIFLKKESE